MTIRDLFVPFEDELQIRPTPRFPHPPVIEWRAEFGDLFFRLKSTDPHILWCDVGYMVTPKRPLPKGRRTALAKRLSPTFRGRSFFRVVPFEDGDEWALVRPRRALIKSPGQPFAAWWEWNASFDREEKTQLEWLSQNLDWFQNWLAERSRKYNRVRYIRDIAALSEKERSWAPVVAPAEQLLRWQKLARSLQILLDPQRQSSSLWSYDVRMSQGNTFLLSLEPGVQFPGGIAHEAFKAAIRLRNELTAHFAFPVEQWRWRGLSQFGERHYHRFPPIELDVPSQHELMEAALLWREFGSEIGKSVEVEKALQEMMNPV